MQILTSKAARLSRSSSLSLPAKFCFVEYGSFRSGEILPVRIFTQANKGRNSAMHTWRKESQERPLTAPHPINNLYF